MKRLIGFFLLVGCFFPFFVGAGQVCDLCHTKSKGHRFFLGPEVYHVHRTREGGTYQNGWLVGGRFLYDHMRRYTFYWAAEAACAKGTLRGKSGNKAHINSRMHDWTFEARFGYTFQYKYGPKYAFTPFAGVGYLSEINNFKRPSPLHLHFNISYRYITAGFISSMNFSDHFNMGLNLKVRHLIDPECKISNDPEFETVNLKIANEVIQYRVELPLTYCINEFALVATPFYETRFYGRSAGYPFDFLKTNLYIYGLTLQLRWVY